MPRYTLFTGTTLATSGGVELVVRSAHTLRAQADAAPLLLFRDHDGAVVDLDLRGSADDAVARALLELDPAQPQQPAPKTRGRPRLGVAPGEVTLLPRHWQWLRKQPRSASATLRLLVEHAMRQSVDPAQRRRSAAYNVMRVLAGDLPGFEDACRAMFAADYPALHCAMEPWPDAIASYIGYLLSPKND